MTLVRPIAGYKHVAHRLIQHTLQVTWRWHGEMKVHVAVIFDMHYW